MDPETQIRKILIAYAESNLGGMVSRQLDQILMDGASPEEMNESAIDQGRKLFKGVINNLGEDHPVSEVAQGMIDELSTNMASAPSM